MLPIAIPRQSQELSRKEFLGLLSTLLSKKNNVSVFEKRLASFIGVKETITFYSLRQGLFWVLKSLDFRKNDEIIVPAYEFFAIPATIIQAELKPVFVDVNQNDYTINPGEIEKAITKKTRAILVAHLNGYPAEMNKIMKIAQKYRLRIIEDCAHAFGTEYKGKKVGSFDIGCFSFGFGKPISTGGGGLVTTNDKSLVERLRNLRQNFKEISFLNQLILAFEILLVRILTLPSVFFFTAYPFLLLRRMAIWEEKISFSKKIPQSYQLKFSNLKATLGIEQLNQVIRRDQARIKNASLYNQHLAKLKQLHLLPTARNGKNVYLHYPIRLKGVNDFVDAMLLKRINVQKDYCCDCSSLEILKDYQTHCPVAKSLNGKIVFLPNHPSLGMNEILYIIKEINNYCQNR